MNCVLNGTFKIWKQFVADNNNFDYIKWLSLYSKKGKSFPIVEMKKRDEVYSFFCIKICN